MSTHLSPATIERRILLIHGHKGILDSDLADLYGVSTKRLNEQVRRNIRRFPADFMFQLSLDEATALRSQNATLDSGRGRHRKYLPYVFTEQGVAMLSSVLHSERAVQVNIEIMRAFVRLRELIGTNRDLARRLDELEKRYDTQFKGVFDAIRQLMAPPAKAQRSHGILMNTFRCPCRISLSPGSFRVEDAGPRYRVRRVRRRT